MRGGDVGLEVSVAMALLFEVVLLCVWRRTVVFGRHDCQSNIWQLWAGRHMCRREYRGLHHLELQRGEAVLGYRGQEASVPRVSLGVMSMAGGCMAGWLAGP